MVVFSDNLKSKFTKGALVVGFFVLAFLLPSLIPQAKAAATSTLRGVAWWGVYGDVYFNCLDYESGSRLDLEGNLTYPPGFLFYSAPCSYGNDHYVGIDANNNFFGSAWNFSQGYIAFSGTTTPPDGYGTTSSNCEATCNASNECWACYNEAEKKVYGWARVESSGEWIKLHTSFSTLSDNRPVSIETCAATPLIYKSYAPDVPAMINPGDFYGAATSTNAIMYFNCLGEVGSNNCTVRNYKVYISTVTVGAMSAPNFSYSQACQSTTGLGATLGWCVRSGQQTAYEIVVHTTDFGASPSAANIAAARCHSGKKYSEYANQYIIPNYDSDCFKAIGLEYSQNYYWWIRLYDENDVPSAWYQYTNNTYSDTDSNPDDNAKTFSTFSHKFPSPYLTWPSDDIFIGTSTEFTSIGPAYPDPGDSVYYTNAAPTVPQSCSGGACSYFWQTSDPLAEISTPNNATTSIIFYSATNTTVSLSITDLENYMCIATLPLKKINYDLPIWREVKAR